MIYWQLYKINSKFPFEDASLRDFDVSTSQVTPSTPAASGQGADESHRDNSGSPSLSFPCRRWPQNFVGSGTRSFPLASAKMQMAHFLVWWKQYPLSRTEEKWIVTDILHRKKKVSPFNCLKDLYLKKRLPWDHNAIKNRAPVIYKEGHSLSVMGAPTVSTRTSPSWVQGTRERVTWPGKWVSFEVQAPETWRADQLDKYWAK